MKKTVVPVSEGKARRKFDPAFKQEVVSSWQGSGKPASVVAEEFGINPNCLYNWRKAHEGAACPQKPGELAAENAALRLELERVRLQRDILKKTLGILSEPPRNGLPGSTR